MALCSNSIQLHLGHLNAVEKCSNFDVFYQLSSVKPRVLFLKNIPWLETFDGFTGLPPWWYEVLFVCVLRPVLARGLPSRASGVTWVVSRVSCHELTGLNCQSYHRIFLR
jgi:hypothetical protein